MNRQQLKLSDRSTVPCDVTSSPYNAARCEVGGQQFKICDLSTVHGKLDQTGYHSQQQKRHLESQKCLITWHIVGWVIMLNVSLLILVIRSFRKDGRLMSEL